jgi:eukaryotic-like serine/threonine-protein kinase
MLKPGDTFERYTIDAAIGQGGMGCVYRAHDSRLDRRVALKVISDGTAPGGDADARLLREARAAAALDHPNAISIFDVGELAGATYIVMELVSGRTLREAVDDASVPVATRAAWLGDVARALAAAHRRGLVHRDVKPENVMVRDDGVVKVLDFGIARRSAGSVDPSAPTHAPALPTLTKEGIKVGTPVYMAPEQIRGDALDGRADQFSWGVLAYELLTGKPPWRGGGEPLAVVASILTDEVPREPFARAQVPAEIEAVVLRALEKKPDHRFSSMDELARALDAALKGESVRSPESRVTPSRPAAASVPAGNATLLGRYSTEEVQEILARAVEQQEAKRGDTRLAFDDLVAAAREVGVDPEVLRAASRDLRTRQETQASEGAARDAWIRKKRRGFYRHFGIWVIVNVAMVLIGLTEHGTLTDFMVPGLLWGIGVAIHGLRAFMANEDDWREEKEKREQIDRKKRRRAQTIERAIDEGAAALLKTGELLRQRIGAPSVPARVRVSAAAVTDAEREAAAEEEAAAQQREQAERRR